MAASIEQKLDFLLKKIGYVASKTGIAEDSTLSGTKKAPFGEAIPSPLVVPESSIWAQANEIPATPPGSDTSYVRVYLSGSSGHRMTVDNTVSGNRTFIARSTYNDNSSSILGDWIDTSFGADYIIEVYKGDPNSGGVKLSAAGSGTNDTWFFDYSSGVLNFNGTVVPSGVTSTNIYIVGYRYIGIKGVAVPGAGATFTHVTIGDLNITGVSTFFDTTDNTLGNENTGSVQLDGGMGIAKNLTVKQNLHVGGYSEFVGVATFKGGTINLGDADTDDINVSGEFISNLVPDVDDTYSLGTASKQWKNLFINGHAELDNTVISGVSTFSSSLDINSDVDIDGHTELDNVNIAGVTTFQSNAFFGDADYIQMGDAQDLKIGHVGSYSVILDQGEGNLSIGGDGFVDIMNTALDEYKARFTTNGSVELYFDNVNKFETTGYGATVFGTLQSQQLNVSGISTLTGNVSFGSSAFFGDGDKINLGDNNDFQIFHHSNGTGIIQNAGSGQLQIRSDEIRLLNQATDEDYAFFRNDGAVELYYDNSKKFETTGYGATVFGTLQSQQLNVTGVSTYAGAIDANGDLDVDGHTNLDNVSVAGVTTTGGLLDINAGGQANTFKVEDLTDNRVVIAGTGGELEDDANLTFNGSTLAVGVNLDVTGDLDVDGHTELDNVRISGVSTFQNNVHLGDDDKINLGDGDDLKIWHNGSNSIINDEGIGDLYLGGNANVNITNAALDEFKAKFITDGAVELYYDNSKKFETTADGINVLGISTFSGAIDANGDLDVDGHTNLDNVDIAGVTTTSGLLDINAGGQANTFKVEDLTDNRVVIAGTGGELEDDANLTFNGSTLSVGVDLDVTGDLDVDGHTNLDNVSVAGVSTFSDDVNIIDGKKIQLGNSADLQLYHNGTSSYIDNNTQHLYIRSNVDGDDGGNIYIQAKSGEDSIVCNDDGNVQLYYDNVNTFQTNANGIKVQGPSGGSAILYLNADQGSDDIDKFRFKVEDGGPLSIENDASGSWEKSIEITGNGAVSLYHDNVSRLQTTNTGINVVGHSELDNVNISGVATATAFHTGAEGSAIRVTSNTISGPAEMFIDPAGVGDNTGALRIKGDLFVDGTQTVINSTTIELGDFIVGIATTATTDSLADGAGIKIGPDNTFLYDHSNTSLKSSENLNLASSKVYKIDGTDVLSATTLGSGVVNSSLTSLGTLLGLTVSGQTTLNTLGVTGVSTFTGAIDANGDLDVDGHTNLDNVSVAGVSTFTGAIDANGDLDVDGHTNLDNVSVAGVSTFTGSIHLPDSSGDTIGRILFGDGDDFKIYHDGNSYVSNTNAASNLFITSALGLQLRVNSSEAALAATANGTVELYYDGAEKLETTGYGVTVFGTTQTQQLNVTGVSTFSGDIGSSLIPASDDTYDLGAPNDQWRNLYIDGAINTDQLLCSSSADFTSSVEIGGDLKIADKIIHVGDTDTAIRFPAADTVTVETAGSERLIIGPTGVSTFTGAIDANGDLDVDGHTELDNLNVTGVSTFSGNLNLSGNITSNLTISSTDAGNAAAPEFKLYRNSASPADADYLGQIKFAGESDTGVERNYAKITGKILDASNGTEDGIIEFAHIKAGSQNISARFRSDSLQLLNGTNFSVAGDSTFTGDVDANGDLDVDGHTNLDNVSVAGVTTFAGKIVGAATDNVIPFLYSTFENLPNAGTYHGAFAHVHNRGKGYFAHANAWYELVNKELNGTVGTGTERYDVEYIDAAGSNVTGVSTSATLNVGVGGTVLNASVNNSRVGINSVTPAYALDVVGDINSSTDIKVNGVSIVVSGTPASTDDVVALAIALG